jgi:hypothetical protein
MKRSTVIVLVVAGVCLFGLALLAVAAVVAGLFWYGAAAAPRAAPAAVMAPPSPCLEAPQRAEAHAEARPPAVFESTSTAAPAPTPATGGAAPAASGGLGTVAFRRVMEPNEKAFSMLIPAGWVVEGGIFRVNVLATGQAGNAVDAKVNMAIKRDAAGTVMLRALPSMMYADSREHPAGAMFPPGSTLNGFPVVYKMTPEQFLTGYCFRQLHPQAVGAAAVDSRKLARLAQDYQRRTAALPIVGQSFIYDAAAVTVEYTEGGIRYRERMVTLIQDFGKVGVGLWSNMETHTFRAPAAEFDRWAAVAGVMLSSLQFNPQWIQGELRGQLQRIGTIQDVQATIQRIDKEIVAHRQQTNAEINQDMFLTLTGQEDYVNPITKQVERDSNQWKYRWSAPGGEVVFTDDPAYDPNFGPNAAFNRTDFQKTPVRAR